VDEVWRRLDCVVMPSRTAPRWVEAVPAPRWSDGPAIPVVASDSGAPGAVGAGGIIVPEEDVAALGATLQRLHDDRRADRLGSVGRQRIMDSSPTRRSPRRRSTSGAPPSAQTLDIALLTVNFAIMPLPLSRATLVE
jgi:hypothetical protein